MITEKFMVAYRMIVKTSVIMLMETPQIFKAELLIEAYDLVQKNGQRVTDEVSAMELIQCSTRLVANEEPNLKITYPEDIVLAEKMIS